MGLDHPRLSAALRKWQGFLPEQIGVAVMGDDGDAVLSWWAVETTGRGGTRSAFLQRIAVDGKGKRLPSIERKAGLLFENVPTEPTLSAGDRQQILHDFIEPMLQRNLHQKGLVEEGGGYSATLVGWLEIEATVKDGL